jgi:hypothetical protein
MSSDIKSNPAWDRYWVLIGQGKRKEAAEAFAAAQALDSSRRTTAKLEAMRRTTVRMRAVVG